MSVDWLHIQAYHIIRSVDSDACRANSHSHVSSSDSNPYSSDNILCNYGNCDKRGNWVKAVIDKTKAWLGVIRHIAQSWQIITGESY